MHTASGKPPKFNAMRLSLWSGLIRLTDDGRVELDMHRSSRTSSPEP
jgi:hypothetical protein